MALAPGAHLGVYEVIGLIGSGGMGEVYRAHDRKLQRDVAIKVLPHALGDDPERLARFEREAKTLAALSHPNIAHIYGFDDSAGGPALIMELIEGPTLADRIAKGPIPLDEALPIAKQIAEGLEAAHEQGIIHRDLKPANIKVSDDGTVKILDFGLAKALESQPASGINATQSPTITTPALMTGLGVVLGTAAYMSPEQAKGQPADKRSDIWAFGCVLYEMLTGNRAFGGEDVSDTLAAVLRDEPDWTALSATPRSVVAIMKGCLDKNHKRRIADTAVFLFVLNQPAAEAAADRVDRRAWFPYAPGAVSLALVLSAVVGFAAWRFKPAPAAPVGRVAIVLPEGQLLGSGRGGMVAVSPDGSQIAYVASGQIHIRSLSEFADHVLAGVDGVGVQSPVFAPDGRTIAFYANRTLKRIATSGGAAVTICSVDESPYGMEWGDYGIVFGAAGNGVMRVSASGGTPEILVRLNSGEAANAPQLLPGGRSILFTLASGSSGPLWERSNIVAQSIATRERKILVEGANYARYVPTGHLVYAVGGILLGVRFDPGRLQIVGSPVPVIEGIRRSNNTGAVHFNFSDTGALVYVPGPANVSRTSATLVLVDRGGHAEPLKLPPGPYEHPRLSPDGATIVYGMEDGKDADVAVISLVQATAPRRLTFGGKNRFPIWTTDGRRVTFQSDRGGDPGIYWEPADASGMAERLTKADPGTSHAPESWSPTGDVLLFSITKGASVSLWSYSTRTKQIAPVDAIQSSLPTNASFSPDGRWIAYTANEQSRYGLYVQPFPPTGAKFLVSPDQGIAPVWSHDGRELYFNFPGQLMKSSVTTQPTFTVGLPVPLPTARGGIDMSWPGQRTYDVTATGKMLGVMPFGQPVGAPFGTEIRLVLNWFEELKTRVPTK